MAAELEAVLRSVERQLASIRAAIDAIESTLRSAVDNARVGLEMALFNLGSGSSHFDLRRELEEFEKRQAILFAHIDARFEEMIAYINKIMAKCAPSRSTALTAPGSANTSSGSSSNASSGSSSDDGVSAMIATAVMTEVVTSLSDSSFSPDPSLSSSSSFDSGGGTSDGGGASGSW